MDTRLSRVHTNGNGRHTENVKPREPVQPEYAYHPKYDPDLKSPWLQQGNDTPLTRLLDETKAVLHQKHIRLALEDSTSLRWFNTSLKAEAAPDILLSDPILRGDVTQALTAVASEIEKAGIEPTYPNEKPLHDKLQEVLSEVLSLSKAPGYRTR